jgi:predicted CopG family antitoxin
MAVKTITIDLEAYEALRRWKRPGQSFSDVVKEHFRGAATGRVLSRILDDIPIDPSTLDAAERMIEQRSTDRAEAPDL